MASCHPLSEANSSPTYRWSTPFTRLRKENSFGEFVKKIKFYYSRHLRTLEGTKKEEGFPPPSPIKSNIFTIKEGYTFIRG
ncbi:hypothetical protein CN609_09160 [Bacillus wiedmannii]|nr:hypothetical protein CN609_09160 [Bacillus wiedmannii]